MPKYLFSYHGGGDMPESEEEGQKIMQAWMSWFGKLGSAVVDGGNPLGATKTVLANGSVKDGGGANPVNGYSIVSAANIDEAVKMAKGCPSLADGGTVEVGEIIEMG